MPRKKTNEEFVNQLKEKSPDISPLEVYINSKTKIRFKCQVCNNVWEASPAHILSGEGCPICAREAVSKQRRLSQEEFSNRLNEKNPNITVIGSYINSITKIKVRCDICGNIWDVVPSSLLHGVGCPKCSKRYRRNTQDFIHELSIINPHIIVLSEYKNAHAKIRVRCNRCSSEWEVEPNSLLKGADCPYCGRSQTSVIEQIIYHSFRLVEKDGYVKSRDRSVIGKELDIYIQSLNLAIEFGAWYWHANRVDQDEEKRKLCEHAGIRLITIYEGCPPDVTIKSNEDVILFNSVISSEIKYRSIKSVILNLCDSYNLDSGIINEEWEAIVKLAKESSRKQDEDKFRKELSIANPTITYISGYTGLKNKLTVSCSICGTKWNASSAYDLLHGHGCPTCAQKKRRESQYLDANVFNERVTNINPQIELLEDYKGPNKDILCQCRICGYRWHAKPANILYRKRNCPNCSPVTKKTHDVFIEELSQINPSISPSEQYINGRTSIGFKCSICGFEWKARPSDVLKGSGCPKCSHRVGMTHEEFVNRVTEKNKDIIIVGKYVNSKEKIKCRCNICGYEWEGLPSNLLKGSGCQRCANTLPLTNELFQTRLKNINPNITPLEEYRNKSTKILCQCLVCNFEWRVTPSNLLNGHGCPSCKANNAKKRRSREIICVETGEKFSSISEAKEVTGISTISDCLNKRTLTAGGFHWEYV